MNGPAAAGTANTSPVRIKPISPFRMFMRISKIGRAAGRLATVLRLDGAPGLVRRRNRLVQEDLADDLVPVSGWTIDLVARHARERPAGALVDRHVGELRAAVDG